MIDKTIAEHLQERGEVYRGMKNGANCPNIDKKGRCAWPGKIRSITLLSHT